ncbi:hypothetical protein U8D42_28780 (plasmid) [Mycobacterium europaeum]|uniref:hypothetical protein n=1 Tax=Mycobacterium TaxID=1763 RepID=UPI000ACBDA5C|nr:MULTISPECIES: hypothetical protein [Mycobacterium]MCV7120453.1 hypothetical protein [Mycobacterium nebraskense]MCV7328247.1 hypothetical protein [Mycobacterium intracellulare subsp. chimaera]MEA1162971.1 hypothetical protein [Mycobacterium europaeum]
MSKHPASLRVVVVEIGRSRPRQGAVFDPHPAAGQVSELSGVALASDQRLKHVANRDGD